VSGRTRVRNRRRPY